MINKITVLFFFLMTGIAFSQEKNTANDYVEKHHTTARYLMKENGIPASVILGVAMHESANGNSKIAKRQNNHFGLKGSKYNRVHKTRYKVFDSAFEGYRYFIEMMKGRKILTNLFERKETNPDVWLKHIRKSGYAKDRRWKGRIMDIIKKNGLEQFDSLIFSNDEILDTLNKITS